jgi:hypothetical protein
VAGLAQVIGGSHAAETSADDSDFHEVAPWSVA